MRKFIYLIACCAILSGCVEASTTYASPELESGSRGDENDLGETLPEPPVADPPPADPPPADPPPAQEDNGGGNDVSADCSGSEHPGASWTTYSCGPHSRYSFPTSGMPHVAKGRVTFKLKGLHRSEIDGGGGSYVAFGFFYVSGGQEANFNIKLYDSGGDYITTQLGSQRFDKTCSPWCEHRDRGTGVQYDRETTYYFDMQWDSGSVWVNVTDGNGSDFSGSVSTDGRYEGLKYFMVGNGAMDGGGGVDSALEVFDLRMSIF